MMRERILLGLVLSLLVVGVAHATIFLPPAEDDEFPAAKMTITFTISSTTSTLQCAGVMRVHRNDPLSSTVQTEMTALDLTCAPSSSGASDVRVSLNPAKGPSLGQISDSGASSFDVFFQITGLPQGTVHNESPMHVQANITHITPYNSQYSNTSQVTVYDVSLVPIGFFGVCLIQVGGQVKPESSGEFSPVFSCFYECKPNRFSALYWREETTLMLVNQSATFPVFARLLIIDGNENPIRLTSTTLSPMDLDEINICETLNLGGAPVPQAGVVEVLLTAGPFFAPTGGAYGWVKNVVGSFVRGNPEPFAGFVTAVGKTECRLVGNNVVTPATLAQRMAGVPGVPPVLIEGTNP